MNRPDLKTWALELAKVISTRSRDPSTQVGSIILRPDNTVVSMGYNGFPRGIDDDKALYADRNTKLLRTIHAEINAIITAKEPLVGYTLYVAPLHPCANCAAVIIQSGIKNVIAKCQIREDTKWRESFDQAAKMFQEAGVNVELISTH